MIRPSRATTPGSANRPKSSTTPLRKRDDADRPAWNDQIAGDMDKYKLTPEQMARKKQQRVSKNMVSLSASKQQHDTPGWGGQAPKHHISPDARSDVHSPDVISSNRRGNSDTPEGAQTNRSRSRSETPSSPPINYAAVLQLLNKHREGGLHSPKRFSPSAQQESTSAGGPIPDPRANASQAPIQPEFDATLGGFSRLDLSSSSAHTFEGATPISAAAPVYDSAPVFNNAPSSTQAPVYGKARLPSSEGGGYALAAAPPPPLSLGAAMDSMWDKQHGMDARLEGVEATLANVQGSMARVEDFEDIRATVRQLSADQARMRSDLQSFSNHATQLMSVLQAQVQQLLQLGGQQRPPTQQSQSQLPPQQQLYPSVQQQQEHSHFQPPAQQQQQQQQQPPQQQTQQQGVFDSSSHPHPQHFLNPSVQGLVPHLALNNNSSNNNNNNSNNNSNTAGSRDEQPPHTEHPHPRRSLFTDLPTQTAAAPNAPNPVASTSPPTQHQSAQRSLFGSIDDASLSLPSYAAMRRSNAGITQASHNTSHFPRPLVSTTQPHPYPTPAPPSSQMNPSSLYPSIQPSGPASDALHINNITSNSHNNNSITYPPPTAADVAHSLASIHAPTHPPAMGIAPRTMPSSFQPRVLGAPAPAGVPADAFVGQGATGAVAAAGGNLAAFGMDLPAHRLGGPHLGEHGLRLPGDSSRDTTNIDNSPKSEGLSSAGMQGMTNSLGVSHPEPLLFDVASDFKIVRVGGPGAGKGGAPQNSLSLAAHTSAAARQVARRK